MCGIFAFLYTDNRYSAPYHAVRFGSQLDTMRKQASRIQHRGPDETREHVRMVNGLGACLIFHRLAINDLSPAGAQPMTHPDDAGIILMCNGEIYNYKALAIEYDITLKGHSDCEIILHLYKLLGFEKMRQIIRGYFSMVLVDYNKGRFYIARDYIGVRSLFYAETEEGVVIASEIKALMGLKYKEIDQAPTNAYYMGEVGHPLRYMDSWYITNSFVPMLPTSKDDNIFLSDISELVRNNLTNAVRRCLTTTDREVGCLLSGGLDSSLIAGIASRILNQQGRRLRTFSIGMEGSTDLRYAREVAAYLNTDHTEVLVTPEELLMAIPDTIRQIETCDTTTVRASTPMYLLCRYIKANTNIAVVLSGEGSDEICGSYMYFHNAPSKGDFHMECLRRIHDLSYFDVLRCDKCTAGAGLEVRVPFLNENFRDMYLCLPANWRMPSHWGIEKYLLRKAFSGTNTIPETVIWRPKEGMSDGVSSQSRSWYQIIQDYAQSQIREPNETEYIPQSSYNSPKTIDGKWFRQIFNEYYGNELRENERCVFRYYWLPKWSGDVVDPSARVLSVYKQ